MAEAAEQATHVAGERPHIGALAALGPEHGVVEVGDVDEAQAVNLDRAGLQLDHLAVAGEIIGALAIDLDGREARWNLRDGAGELRKDRADVVGRGPRSAGGINAPLGVVGVALLAPAHGELIDLASIHHKRNGLGRLPERDREQTRSERVERAGMAGALGAVEPLCHAHRMSGGHANRLVEHEPAVHIAFLAPALPRRLVHGRRCQVDALIHSGSFPSSGLLRSRWTAGVRNSFSMRSASSKRSSTRKRISGANFRLTRCAISPRRKRLLRSSAASTSVWSRPPSGIT